MEKFKINACLYSFGDNPIILHDILGCLLSTELYAGQIEKANTWINTNYFQYRVWRNV
jgi:hypothetical protein